MNTPKKRLVVCCDGTWNSLEQDGTNVVKLAQACKPFAEDGTPQIVYYDEGLGTSALKLDKILGGAFGFGIDKNIQEAYRFLCLNYDEGDEVYLFGFSRGAYTVRSLAGMIYCSGLLKREDLDKVPDAYWLYRDRSPKTKPGGDQATNFRQGNSDFSASALPFSDQKGQHFHRQKSDQIPIKLLGCWDTVGALGIPQVIGWLPLNDIFNRRYKFHDVQVNRKVENALHAIAIDERRQAFDVSRMQPSNGAKTHIKEMWFPGTHGCVGGGTDENRGLSDAAFQWMIAESTKLGLEFNQNWIAQTVKPNPYIPFKTSLGIYALAGPNDRAIETKPEYIEKAIATQRQKAAQKADRSLAPETLEAILEKTLESYEYYTVALHSSVKQRYAEIQSYRQSLQTRKNLSNAVRADLQDLVSQGI